MSEASWDLSHLFPDERSFWSAFSDLDQRVAQGARWEKASLSHSGELLAAVSEYFGTLRAFGRLSVYAQASSDEDTRDGPRWARRLKVQELGAKLAAAWAWLAPRVAQLGLERVEASLSEEPALAEYGFFLRNAVRHGPHLLPEAAERVLAELSPVARAPYNLYQLLTHADFPFPEITLTDGQKVLVDQTAYMSLREHRDRAVRERAARAFFATYRKFSRTLACALDAHLRHHVTEGRLRGFASALEAALFLSAIPEEVYHRLLAEAEKLLPLLFRLFALRRQVLGLDQLEFFDLYVPWGEDTFGRITLEQGTQLLVESLAPLGEEYLAILQGGLAGGWMDPYPRRGKRSGAYCTGEAYDVHPYVLMNFQGTLDSVSTMAHEWGHAVHSALANRAQPYPTAEYPIFLAEIASTLNENLLFHHLLGQFPEPSRKLFVLSHFLEHIRATFFRQSQFAEFELACYRRVESGEALTGETLTALYGEVQRRWLGHYAGAVRVDEDFTVEWAFIPHFYYDFYVYQYATSLAASTFFARQILAGEPKARERYLQLLKAGGSAYPYELLCRAGVDLASPEPYQELGVFLSGILEEGERLVAKASENRVLQPAVS
ncbi:MAG: oligoendopeptidase F [Thermoanaerobaculum sp.]